MLLRRYALADTEDVSVEQGRRAVRFVASTSRLDSHGTIIDQDWDLRDFARNPVVLWNHGMGSAENGIPIARAEDVGVIDGALRATVVFPEAGRFGLSDDVFNAVQDRRVNAMSVGFGRPREVLEERRGDDVVYRYRGNTLKEVSIVAIGSNPDALAERALWRRGDSMDLMIRIAKVLGVAEDVPHEELVRNLEHVRSVLTRTNSQTLEQALGVVTAWEASHLALAAAQKELADVRAAADARERAGLIDGLRNEGKVTPAMEADFLAVLSLEQLRSFAAHAPVVAPKAPALEPPAVNALNGIFEGRSVKEIVEAPEDYALLHRLAVADRALFDEVMRLRRNKA